jgi:3-phenylpropionate/cinnamic acid dioxygenase small subunit
MQQTDFKMLADLPEGRSNPPVPQGLQIPFGDARYNAAMHFLIEEAHCLDENQFREWMALLTEDIVYTAPVRQTMSRDDGRGFYPGSNWIYDDLGSIAFKLKRNLESDSAFAEDPPTRTRRLVTNMRLFETDNPSELLAISSVLLRRNRGDNAISDEISARRDDIIRSDGDGLKLARRTVWLDHTVLGMSNLAVYL